MGLRHSCPWHALTVQPFSVWIGGARQGYRRLGNRPSKQAGLYFAEGLAKGRDVHALARRVAGRVFEPLDSSGMV